jgi:hypothetical protein
MANAREKRFRPAPKFEAKTVEQVEQNILTVLNGGAPENVTYIDVEEKWGAGGWKQIGGPK